MEIIKIPEKRVSSLIGDNGKTKKRIEKVCNVKLSIHEEGEVEINGETADEFFAIDVIKAIGRGFEPNDALLVIKDDYQFFLMDLKGYLSNEKAIKRIKGRVIGEKGKIKIEIEEATESKISIYGNTIGIIAKLDTIEYAKEAVLMIVNGSTHNRVFGYLGRIRKQILADRLKG